LATLARSLGKHGSIRRERNLDELSGYLSEHERQTLVIVMDDAQNATHATLEELRLLLGLNLPSQPTFALILIGDEYLLGQLQLRNHRALCSRLSAHHLLSPWTSDEIHAYLKTALEAVGIHRSKVFEPAAEDLLVRAFPNMASACSRGMPTFTRLKASTICRPSAGFAGRTVCVRSISRVHSRPRCEPLGRVAVHAVTQQTAKPMMIEERCIAQLTMRVSGVPLRGHRTRWVSAPLSFGYVLWRVHNGR
jgi:hypothetical protein